MCKNKEDEEFLLSRSKQLFLLRKKGTGDEYFNFTYHNIKSILEELLKRLNDSGRIKTSCVYSVTKYLYENNFYELPSSINFNYDYRSGLLDHSFACAIYLAEMVKSVNTVNPDKQLDISIDEALFIGFFHDICKTKEFKIDKTKSLCKYKDNRWYEDTSVLGHSNLSLQILRDLGITNISDGVTFAIKYHMGYWGHNRDEYLDVYQKYPIVGMTHIADTITTFWEKGNGCSDEE